MATVAVNWGDGSAVENVTVIGDATSWHFDDAPHSYATAGTFTVTVTGLSGGVGAAQAVTTLVEVVVAGPVTINGHNVLLDATGTRS